MDLILNIIMVLCILLVAAFWCVWAVRTIRPKAPSPTTPSTAAPMTSQRHTGSSITNYSHRVGGAVYQNKSVPSPLEENEVTLQLKPENSILSQTELNETMLLQDSRTEEIFPMSDYVEIGLSSLRGTRDYQQDSVNASIGIEPMTGREMAVGVLCDGMGGMEGGEKASAFAVAYMMHMMRGPHTDYPQALRTCAIQMSERVRCLRDERDMKLQAGTTLTCTVMSDSNLYWCSVGDSRIYLIRNDDIIQLTVDHIFAYELEKMADRGEISREEARTHPKRAALTSYIGMPGFSKIDLNQTALELRPNDVILQCCDGLYRAMSSAEMLSVVRCCDGDMQQAARQLTAMAVKKPGSHDNTSVLLLRYKG